MSKENVQKIIFSIVGVGILIFAVIMLNNSYISSSDGVVTICLVDLDEEILIRKDIEFTEGDALVELIEKNFSNVSFDNGMLMTIESYQTPTDFSTFLSVFVDGVMSEVGLSEVEFSEGTVIELKITEFIYNYE